MNYTEADFERLVAEVEEQGGTLRTDQCKAKKYTWSGKSLAPQTIAGCGNPFRFDVPYEPYGGNLIQKVMVCAVEDNVGMWPRFRHVIQDKETG